VYVIESSFATASEPCLETITKQGEVGRQKKPYNTAMMVCVSCRILQRQNGVDQRSGPLFIMRFPLIISRPTRDFTLLPQYANLLTVTSFRAIHVFHSDTTQYGPSVGVPKTIFAF
jgi:hypothetical protein